MSSVHWRRKSKKYFASDRIRRPVARYPSPRPDDPLTTRNTGFSLPRVSMKEFGFPARPSGFEPTTSTSIDRSAGATWQYFSARFPSLRVHVRVAVRVYTFPCACERVRCCFQPVRLLFSRISSRFQLTIFLYEIRLE